MAFRKQVPYFFKNGLLDPSINLGKEYIEIIAAIPDSEFSTSFCININFVLTFILTFNFAQKILF